MDWMTVVLTLIPSILLLTQGVSCLNRPDAPPYIRQFGSLCVTLSGLSFVLCLLLASGTLVLSTEFGIVMAQGLWGGSGLATLLIGSALGAAVGHHVCSLEASQPTGLRGPLIIGLIVGLLAAGRLLLLPLNAGDAIPLRIYAYDLWWPPLLIYFGTCLIDSALQLLRVHHKPSRLWVATAFAGGLTLLALSQPQLSATTPGNLVKGSLLILFPASISTMWKGCLFLLFPASISLVTWLCMRISRSRLTRLQWSSRWVLIGLPAGVGILSSVLWASGSSLAAQLLSWPWLLWLSWPLVVGLVSPHQLGRAWRDRRVYWQTLPRPTMQQGIMLGAIAVLAIGFAALVNFVRLDRSLMPAGFVMAWIFLAEAIARGPLSHLLRQLIDSQKWSDFGIRVLTIGRGPVSWLKSLLSVPSMPVLIGKALVGVALLVALSELPNAQKTLIQPFKVHGLPERTGLGKDPSERAQTGQAISEQVTNTLGLIQQELLQEIILSLQPDSDDEGGRKTFELTSVADSSNVSATLSKSSDLEVYGVKIPMSSLVAPVQGPVRWLLGVRSINASIQFAQGGDYSLLARSDTGETWKFLVSPDKPSLFAAPVPPEANKASKAQISPEVIDHLATELAFHIIQSDKLLAPALTKSSEAFRLFQQGLAKWRKFESDQDYDIIGQAIAYFSQAVQKDPEFAFAHYRLGLALQKDGQPGLAVKAFQASIKADPHLTAAYIALASTLYDFERTSFLAEVGSPLDFLSRLPAQDERVDKARDLWMQVLRLPERDGSVANLGSAYYGLCRYAFRQGRKEARRTLQQGEKHSVPREASQTRDLKMDPESWFRMAYYYCKRAEALYASLATAKQANLEVKKGEAYVLSTLGNVLSNFQQRQDASRAQRLANPQGRMESSPRHQPAWKCWTDVENRFPSREGLRYFTRALELLPDDYRLRCHAARTAYDLGDPRPLQQLEKDAQAHLHKANAYRRVAKVCAGIDREELSSAGRARIKTPSYRRYDQMCNPKRGNDKNAQRNPEDRGLRIAEAYRSALHEYEEVIWREPMSIEAMTSYAHTVWEWLTYAGHDRRFHGRIEYYAERALHHAVTAVGLAERSSDHRVQHMAISSRGRARLARGNYAWAIEDLAQVVAAMANHAAFHEVRWALAQAYLCAASYNQIVGFHVDAEQSEKAGKVHLGIIRQEESVREFPLFSSRPDVPESALGKLICRPNWEVEIPPEPPTMAVSPTLTATAHLNR